MTTSRSDFRGIPVSLYDGRVVDSYSEEWRAECEARSILAMPLHKRQQFLFGKPDRFNKMAGGLEQKRSPEAFAAILDLIRRLHAHSKNQSSA